MKNIEGFKFSKFLNKYLQDLLQKSTANHGGDIKVNPIELPRTLSICPNADVCGSCPLSHIPYNLQLTIKKEYVSSLLKLAEVSNISPPLKKALSSINIIPSVPNAHYRNRMDFAVDIKGNLGLKQKGLWYKIIPHHKCFLSASSIEKAFDLTEKAFHKFKVKGYDRKLHQGFLSFVVIRGNLQGDVTINYILRKDVLVNLISTNKDLFTEHMYALGRATNYILKEAFKYGIKVQGGSLAITNSLREESTGDVIFVYTVGGNKSIKLIQLGISNLPEYLDEVKSGLQDGLYNLIQGFNKKGFENKLGQHKSATRGEIKTKTVKDINNYLPAIPVVFHGVTYKILPFSFFQPNLYTASILQQLVAFYATFQDKNIIPTNMRPKLHILDLFGGQGFLGGFIAYYFNVSTDVIEVDQNAVNYGVRLWQEYVPNTKAVDMQDIIGGLADKLSAKTINDEQNQISDLRMIHADAYDIDIPDIYNVIILDPPRRGLTKRLLKKLLKLESLKRIVYVSCNIKQFSMEYVKHLSKIYELKNVILLDQFPHTEHIESVIILDKK